MLLARRGDNRSDFLSQNYLDKIYVSISFHNRNVLGTVSRLFVRPGFRLFCARLAVHYLAVYSVLGNLNFNGNEYNGCVSVGYNSLFISLPL